MKYANLPPDKQIGNYQWNQNALLGQGAFGKVYLGKDIRTDQFVAIKVIDNATFMKDSYLKQALENEINIMKKVKGNNTVGLYDQLNSANRCYIISEFCNQGDLRHFMNQKEQIGEQEAKKILIDLLKGFNELVKNNIIHRDLKPENILINDNVFKLCDFGFGKSLSGNFANQMLQTQVGTPLYMSPQILKNQYYTTKSRLLMIALIIFKGDIWSLGNIYYELLYGKTPWPAKSQYELIQNIETKPVTFPNKVKISNQSKDFIKGCLQVDEKSRFSWEDLFNHSIFKQQQLQYQKTINLDNISTKIILKLQILIPKQNIDIKKLFDKFDKEKTGDLNMQEFTDFILKVDKTLEPEQIQNIFEQFDVNHDQSISFQEFHSLIMETDYSEQQNVTMIFINAEKCMKKLIQIINHYKINVDQIFKKFDKSKTGELSQHEFYQVCKVIDENITDKEVDYIFKKFDTDNSKSISVDEFKTQLGLIQQQKQSQTQNQLSPSPNNGSDSTSPEKYRNMKYRPSIATNIRIIGQALPNILTIREIILAKQIDLEKVFNHFDNSKTGCMNFQCFLEMLNSLQIKIDQNNAYDVFRSFDPDNKNYIEFEEFAKILQ